MNMKNWLPDTSSGFWRFCLLASLMLNLLVAGLMAGHMFHDERGQGPGAARYGQFVPRKFFGELDKDRRHELAGLLRDSKPDFEKLRHASDDQASKLAAELSSPTYDATKVNALIDSFTTGQDSVAAKGGAVLKDFYAKLKPEERLILAKEIMERANK